MQELDQLADGGCVSVYFVDDNFIGNPKAAESLLDALIEWQKRRDCQVRLACEATLNMAGHTRILEKMQQAFFTNCFFGIETPDPKALKAMKKGQNMRMPILEAVQTVNRYGIEAASGIIMGLDTDTDETPQALIDFAEVSNIPIMTVNILYALPNTALYTRLEKENRVLHDAEDRDSNIVFLQPYETVVRNWPAGDRPRFLAGTSLCALRLQREAHVPEPHQAEESDEPGDVAEHLPRARDFRTHPLARRRLQRLPETFLEDGVDRAEAGQRRDDVPGRDGRAPFDHLRARNARRARCSRRITRSGASRKDREAERLAAA